MRRNLTALSLSALLGLTATAPLRAQESTTRGFNVGIHASGASLQVDDERSNAGGGGLWLGYGLNRTVQLFLQLDGAEFDVENTNVDGKWTMGHVDLGARFHFANSLRMWVPYLQAALSARGVSVDNAVVSGSPETDVGFYGGAFTIGGGILLYFTETLAADIQGALSFGEFTQIRVNNVTVSGLHVDAQSSRLNLGLSWWP